jgi:hypothetical protein
MAKIRRYRDFAYNAMRLIEGQINHSGPAPASHFLFPRATIAIFVRRRLDYVCFGRARR